MNWRVGLIILSVLIFPHAARAACTSPTGSEGQNIYNNGSHIFQYCNGTNWVSYGAIDPGAGGGGCTSPAGVERQMIYNYDYHVMQYCDGTNWMQVGGYAKAASCPDGYSLHGSSCYRLVNVSGQWSSGRSACQSEGGDLLVINDAAEWTFIQSFVRNGTYFVGLSSPTDGSTGDYQWVSSSAWSISWCGGSAPTGSYYYPAAFIDGTNHCLAADSGFYAPKSYLCEHATQ